MTEPKRVTYFAMSVFSSRTMWLNALSILVGILSLTEVVTIIPPEYMPTYSMVIAALNMILRKQTVRPVSFIAPGTSEPKSVPMIDPPKPPMVSD